MGLNVLAVGAVALGLQSGLPCQAAAEITMIEKEDRFSYGGCGIPYFVGGDVPTIEGFCSTSAHTVRDDIFFKKVKGISIRSRTEAISIDRKEKTLPVDDLNSGITAALPYDKLVLPTGATPVVPPIPGADLPGVSVVSNLNHAKQIKEKIVNGGVESAVVIGGGAIGLEPRTRTSTGSAS